MAGLVSAIHASLALNAARTWIPGTSPGTTGFVVKLCFIGCAIDDYHSAEPEKPEHV